jgi:predicted acylesterase/phospholipase RssA
MKITHLVLSGGALKALCFIGIMQYLYLESFDKDIKNIACCSMGSIIGLMFGLNIPVEDMQKLFLKALNDKKTAYVDKKEYINLFYKCGVVSSYIYMEMIQTYIKERDGIDDITFIEFSKKYGVNLYMSATNIYTCKNEIFSIDTTPNLSVFKACSASIAIPLLYQPVKIDGYYYLDGGLTNNFPIEVFKDVPRENILAVALQGNKKLDIDIPIEKNTKPNILMLSQQVFKLLNITRNDAVLLNKIDNNCTLIINNSPIKGWMKFEVGLNGCKASITEDDINNAIFIGFDNVFNYMNERNEKYNKKLEELLKNVL